VLNAVLVVMTLCYPAAVYFGIEYLEPKYFALILLSLFGLRYLITVKTATTNVALALFVVVTIFAGWAFVSNSEPLLLFYPVIVNVVLLAAFAWSLAFPPSVIERLARITDPNLPPGAVAYTRRVTVAWCFFFR
jgi:uncharacterized membrane protein